MLLFCVFVDCSDMVIYHGYLSISAPVVWFGSGEDDNRNEKRHAESTIVHHVCNQLTLFDLI